MKITAIEQASRWFPRERGFDGPFDSELHKIGDFEVLGTPQRDDHIHLLGSDFIVVYTQHIAQAPEGPVSPRAIVYVTYNGASRYPPVTTWVDERDTAERIAARKVDQEELRG